MAAKRYVTVVLVVGIIAVAMAAYIVVVNNYFSSPHTGKITVTDDMGRKVSIDKPANRVVSLAPSNTEILFAIGAGEKVVGVTSYCDYPPEVVEKVNSGEIEIVGGFTDINVEKVVSLQPDVVFAYYGQKDVVEKLESLNISTVVFNPSDLEDIYHDIYIAGLLTGKTVGAENVIKDMKNTVVEVKNKIEGLAKKKVFFVVWGDPLMTAGNGTFIHYLIEEAGGEDIFGDVSSWATVSMESVIERNPDVIILSEHCGMSVNDVLNNWSKEISAVKNGEVYMISDDNIIVRPGPRIVLGLEELAKIIHPEAFEGSQLWNELAVTA